ncbi:MAG: DUF6161 domain-containing protein [Nitrospiraceae bacterium]|nr:DUF6161 domain-containing protein [Nitrospiraceae bacterium]
MTDWKAGIQENTDAMLKEKKQELEDLKKLHSEQLRLKEPARYWEDLATQYEIRGKSWRTWLTASSSLFLVFLVSVLYNLPETLFPGQRFGLGGVKSTLLLAFMASVGIYVVHYLVKMSLSSYHMARDARERFQLTHVYLSLMHEGAVTPEERVIVLQSIFSRSDTGLIKGDGSPTLPDGVVGGILKNIKPS